MHASQHFNRVRLAVPATRDLVCESKVALIECQQQRMLQKQSSKKKEREFQLQMRRSRSRGRSGLFSSSRRTCVSILCVWERERKERGEEEERKRRRREGKEKESSLSRSWRRRRPPASPGVWCLKVYDIISGPDRWQGSGVSPAAGGENFWAFFSPSKQLCVCPG